MKDNNSYALVLGASIVDILGFSRSKYTEKDSIPGNIKISLGGVCRNIAENMARVGVNTKFISIVGDDEQGRNILEHSKVIGYNMEHSLLLENKATPTYMAILDEEGEMVSAIVDMSSLDEMDEDFIDAKRKVIENAEYTFLDSDNPKILEHILKEFAGKTKFVLDPVSAAKAEKIKHLIKYFHTIKPNRYEAEILSGIKINSYEDVRKAGQYFLDLGIKNIFISLDSDGTYYTNGKEEGKIKACDVEVKNTTGAGDSFVAGLGYGYMNNLSLKDTVKYAMAMSVITIRDEDTINPKMSDDYVKYYLDKIKWEEI
ncbi:pfkB family carbohydrate kinase [Clostridium sp. DSM 8431]|uniref:carbohydrate kinase family protein n=1 Tax=Clostridium sp. DSM 8431 TaxID=1761781 RepID=UPI0008EFE504|nr:carbohydrate kinase family protein [Clostridium sp. DSM 8431]SFU28243.1 pfkB family carbohydrate kinase [Clostridium sp. DSM 8431]